MNDQTIEWAPFRLRYGVDEDALLNASRQLQDEFLARQEGFIRRELIRGADGSYVDLVWWHSPDAARAAMRNAETSAVCGAYFDLMGADHSDPGAGVLHFRSVSAY